MSPYAMQANRDRVELLRRVAVHEEVAQLLDWRADRSSSPALSAVLRERAAERRGLAEQLRVRLAASRGRPVE
jgi:hypothetical protein